MIQKNQQRFCLHLFFVLLVVELFCKLRLIETFANWQNNRIKLNVYSRTVQQNNPTYVRNVCINLKKGFYLITRTIAYSGNGHNTFKKQFYDFSFLLIRKTNKK